MLVCFCAGGFVSVDLLLSGGFVLIYFCAGGFVSADLFLCRWVCKC